MNEILRQKIEAFLKEATGESILNECKEFGIDLEDIEYNDEFYADLNDNLFKSTETIDVFKDEKNSNYELAA
ncbi:hypothetical protein IR083_05400 [Dysgonomonas sp. GY75]|uniref:hypothetical protein n=1 Tax=Dysgonomonas sp. GY75 TaxID=2780419 RepID=UPI00188314C6|nr:hypothetical protein [Dysgonomonas sp. GY75]MBF0648244.1 hypothetical protein [Dysgonomonas sp. GY75]